MSRIDRANRRPAQLMALPPNERQHAHNLEMTHGVIVRMNEDRTVEARHWRDDTLLADADDVFELETVLKSLHIYPDPTETV